MAEQRNSSGPQRRLLLLLAALAAIALLVFAWLRDADLSLEGNQFRDDAAPLALLDPLLVGDDGSKTPASTPLPATGTLIFRLRLSRPGSAALLRRHRNQPPEVLARFPELPPGQPRYLEHNKQLLRVPVDTSSQYCIITATDPQQLQTRIDQAPQSWPQLPWRACTHFEPPQL